MNQSYDPSHPFEVLFNQIEDVIDYVAVEKVVFTTQQIVNTICNLVYNTGVFVDECKV